MNYKKFKTALGLWVFLAVLPIIAFAQESADRLDLTGHGVGHISLIIFTLAYLAVISEEFTHLRKSKPVLMAAGLIWLLIGWEYSSNGIPQVAEAAVRVHLLEYAELMLFLLVTMTYVNALEERNVFASLRAWLVNKGFDYRTLFWMTGFIAFFLSPIADNLTTALLLCAIILAIGEGNLRFVSLACINVVVASNAGGAFSPFGDITTLMVWQQGKLDFWSFFVLFVPSLVSYLIPAMLMHFAVPDSKPAAGHELVSLRRGAIRIFILFMLTIVTTVSFTYYLYLPPVIGMLTGLAYLQFFGYFLKKTALRDPADSSAGLKMGTPGTFDIFSAVSRVEWDTLLFFYGVVLCVAGLGFIGYLAFVSETMYSGWGATYANIAVGVFSAIFDSIPIMYGVLTMNPDMQPGQWLLVTLTAGIGGSLLSIGSAAGVALMGQARGKYTFWGHLKWTPAIALGYSAGIYLHMLINSHLF